MEPPLPLLLRVLSTVGSSKNVVNEFFEWFGDLGVFLWRVAWAAVTPPFEFRELFRQLDEVGSKSLPLVALAGGAIGVVLSLETRYSLTRFGAKSLLPAAIVFSVLHEIGPIITGLVVSGRVGAGIGAELASMKVTEQIDAIEASAVNPYKLLAATRILACALMLPFLTLAADLCGLVMGWVALTLVEPISLHQFINDGFKGAGFNDFLPPTFKTAVFGLIIGAIACFQGMRTRGGAEGVGRAATSSVVLSSLFVILADVVLVKVIIIFFPSPSMTTTDQLAMKRADARDAGGAPAVAVSDVQKSFGSQKVLNGISLTVNRGETLAVLGRSGTGKSVLLKLIIGLEKPDSGSVRIHGQDIAGLGLDRLGEIRKKMGFLFQHAALYDSLTVEQNVAFPLEHHRREMSKSARRDRVEELLAEVGMEGNLEKMPSDLSGGMQKRVGLARALVLEPDILLLDEPTAGLDPISSGEIDDLVLKLQEQYRMASIVVTHDLHSAKAIADRLALLNKGNVAIEGTFEELQNSDVECVRDFLKNS